jgi:hypothetical protein
MSGYRTPRTNCVTSYREMESLSIIHKAHWRIRNVARSEGLRLSLEPGQMGCYRAQFERKGRSA